MWYGKGNKMFNKTSLQQKKSNFQKHIKIDDNDCHRWTASKNNLGYGLFKYDGKMRTVHRLIMEWEGYDIDKKIVYHMCDNYDCSNIDHLRIGTLKDKAKIMSIKGRAGLVWADSKYHKTCEHCGYTGTIAVINHRHNDKCKHKP